LFPNRTLHFVTLYKQIKGTKKKREVLIYNVALKRASLGGLVYLKADMRTTLKHFSPVTWLVLACFRFLLWFFSEVLTTSGIKSSLRKCLPFFPGWKNILRLHERFISGMKCRPFVEDRGFC